MDLLLSRRSIRKYTPEPISGEDLAYLLRAAMAAPSAGNEQPWHFVIITERSMIDEIPKFHPYAAMCPEAPMVILICGKLRDLKHDGQFWTQDCSAATQNLLLAAQALGLGAVWLGLYPSANRVAGVREMVGTPAGIEPFALVVVGHPAEAKPPIDRYEPERIHYNHW